MGCEGGVPWGVRVGSHGMRRMAALGVRRMAALGVRRMAALGVRRMAALGADCTSGYGGCRLRSLGTHRGSRGVAVLMVAARAAADRWAAATVGTGGGWAVVGVRAYRH